MKATLSFLKPVRNGLKWIRDGLVMFWRVYKYAFSPTEKNLLVSFWWDFVHFKNRRPGDTLYDFLDERRVFLKRVLTDPGRSGKRKHLYRDLFEALHRPRLRKIFIDFLESPSPEENYQVVVNAMKSAWRSDEEAAVSRDVEPAAAMLQADQPKDEKPVDDQPKAKSKLLNARAYFIAANLHFELQGKSEEFRRLSRRLKDLKTFMKEQFHVTRLPGTFDDLNGYDYKNILKEKQEDARRVQLRQHFRQISEHPEIFGNPIASRAAEIIDEHFY